VQGFDQLSPGAFDPELGGRNRHCAKIARLLTSASRPGD
jgi:hypothetical protein